MKIGDKILEFAQKITAPVVTTFRGKGVIDEDHELYAGSHGTIGSTSASKLVRASDLLIVIGASFSDMTQIPEKRDNPDRYGSHDNRQKLFSRSRFMGKLC